MIRKWLVSYLIALTEECAHGLSWQMENGYLKESYYYKLSELHVAWTSIKIQIILGLLGE